MPETSHAKWLCDGRLGTSGAAVSRRRGRSVAQKAGCACFLKPANQMSREGRDIRQVSQRRTRARGVLGLPRIQLPQVSKREGESRCIETCVLIPLGVVGPSQQRR
jgi:hypothetical protein